jgi:predicted small secreted protein
VIAHIADSYLYYCGRATKRDTQWSDAIEKGATDKAALAPKLAQALASCNTVYAGTGGDIGQLMANVAHTNLHYGNLITYIRMLGMVPPSS